MIGSVKGSVDVIDRSSVILDTGNVGYRISVSSKLLSQIHAGDSLKLYTYTHVREDIFELYGFEKPEDLKLFEKLLEVSGIGPKTALGVFSVGTRDQIYSAIQKGDVSFFTNVPRLGTKNAQKIIIELKGKLDLSSTNGDFSADNDIATALRGFGFKDKEIMEALEAIKDVDADASKKVKLALKYLGK